MDTNLSTILEQLKQEHRQLGVAIATLENLNENHSKRSAGKPGMSAAARRRIAKAQKARWKLWRAKQRGK